MLKKSNTLLISLLIGLTSMQFAFASIKVNLGYLSNADTRSVGIQEGVVMDNNTTTQDIKEKIEKDYKKNVDTRGNHLNIYRMIKKKKKYGMVQELQPLSEVTQVKNGDTYIYRTATKVEYIKNGQKKTTFLESAIDNKSKKMAVYEFCRENKLNHNTMKSNGAGSFTVTDKKSKANDPQGGPSTDNSDDNHNGMSKKKKIILGVIIGAGITIGSGVLLWQMRAASKEEKEDEFSIK